MQQLKKVLRWLLLGREVQLVAIQADADASGTCGAQCLKGAHMRPLQRGRSEGCGKWIGIGCTGAIGAIGGSIVSCSGLSCFRSSLCPLCISPSPVSTFLNW